MLSNYHHVNVQYVCDYYSTAPPCSLAEYIREELKDKPCGL